MKNAQIAVVGSLNIDLTLRAPRLPSPGETLTARQAMTSFGGKGANQAVAAARAGAAVRMIGCTGDDDHGRRYREHLAAERIEIEGILIAKDQPTGSAFITVDDAGENTIVVHPGANHALTVERLEPLAPLFDGMAVLLLQLECPLPAVARAAELGRAAGARVILNPSPWSEAVHDAAIPADILIVNETEAQALTGRPASGLLADAGAILAATRAQTILVTRGSASTLVLDGKGCLEVATPAVTPVDTVGAGDTFAGAFAVALADGQALPEAVAFANTAAALATLKTGAQSSIPTRDQILRADSRCQLEG